MKIQQVLEQVGEEALPLETQKAIIEAFDAAAR